MHCDVSMHFHRFDHHTTSLKISNLLSDLRTLLLILVGRIWSYIKKISSESDDFRYFPYFSTYKQCTDFTRKKITVLLTCLKYVPDYSTLAFCLNSPSRLEPLHIIRNLKTQS